MNDKDEMERTAARLGSALRAAAEVMAVHHAPARQHVKREDQDVKRARGWLLPLAAAAGVVVIALGAVLVAHLGSPAATHSTGAPVTSSTAAQAARPEFYLTATYPPTGPNVLVFQVRRTDGGAVTSSKTISGANVGWGGYVTADASGRAFYFGKYPCTRSTAIPDTTFYRITITNAGKISGFAPVGRPVKGMVTTLAVSPDGSRMAYNALTKACAGRGFTLPGAASVSVENLSTGSVRTWQDNHATQFTLASRLSWAPDGRTLVVDESGRGPSQSDLTVYRLDPASSGGSLQAHSTTLLQQGGNCSTCVATALAGPQGSLTELETQAAGQQTRLLVVNTPSAAGGRRTVLYSKLIDAPAGSGVNATALFTDGSARWVLLWPTTSMPSGRSSGFAAAGWISGGRLHPLPGVAQVFPQGITWLATADLLQPVARSLLAASAAADILLIAR